MSAAQSPRSQAEAMVKIVDGEIYQDDDPRLQEMVRRRQQAPSQPAPGPGPGARPAQPGSSTAAAGGAPAASTFNFNAPPFRLVPPLPGQQPLMGLPDLEIFAVRISPLVIGGLVALLLAFGWRGMIAGGILFYIWQANNAAGQAQGAPPPGPQAGGGGGIFQQLQDSFQQQFGAGPPAQRRQQQQRPGPGPAAGPGQHASAGPQARGGQGPAPVGGAEAGSGSLFSGRGHRLGGN